jgi:acyl-CoA reductase-like NAD-dependent aldehyde dehydrogenase
MFQETIEIKNPYDGTVLGAVAVSSPGQVRRAVQQAKAAAKRGVPSFDRYTVLHRTSELLRDRTEEFALGITREAGKPIRESRLEIERACTTLLWSARESLRTDGIVQSCDTTPQRLQRHAYVHRIPLGVVAAITPFNFPVNIPAHKIGPALAAGNAVILKPSPRTPLVTTRFAELFYEAGLDHDLLQILNGGPSLVEQLVADDVQAVTFTGSSDAGLAICRRAAGKKITMELGGCDPVIVMEDADVDAAVRAIIAHRFAYSRQRCTACKRAIIDASLYQELKERLLAGIEKLVTGDPMKEETDIGPLIDREAALHIVEIIEGARRRGARILCGGGRVDSFVEPTLVENIGPEDPLLLTETFGPVLPIISFWTPAEAIGYVNAAPYGLQAGIFTNNIALLREAFQRLEVGALILNDGPGLRIEPLPFGGVKSSGFGREGIRYAIEELTCLKTLIV